MSGAGRILRKTLLTSSRLSSPVCRAPWSPSHMSSAAETAAAAFDPAGTIPVVTSLDISAG